MSVLDVFLDSPLRESFSSVGGGGPTTPRPGRSATPNAKRDALRSMSPAQRKRATAPRSGGSSGFDAAKHPRGAAGTSAGGKFVSRSGGGSDAEVRAIQHRVGAQPDGKFGPRTEAAVRSYQQRHGLKVDGIVGRQTLAAFSGRRNAASVKPGALSQADRRELRRIRQGQVRRRASAPTRSGGGIVV